MQISLGEYLRLRSLAEEILAVSDMVTEFDLPRLIVIFGVIDLVFFSSTVWSFWFFVIIYDLINVPASFIDLTDRIFETC